MTSLSMDTTRSTLNASSTIKPPGVLDPRIAKAIISIAAPILFLVGMIGNILIIVVIRRGALPSIATTLSFTYLAVVDMIVLVFGLVELWLYYYKYDIMINHTWCAIHLWLIYVGVSLSSWALVFITIQRTISIYLPLKNVSIATKSNTLIGLSVMTILICGLNLPMLWTLVLTTGPPDAGLASAILTGNYFNSSTAAASLTTFTRSNGTITTVDIPSLVAPYCVVPPEHYTFFYGVWTWVDFAIACLVPTVILATGNLLIICRLTTATRKRQEMSQNQDGNNKKHNLSIMLISITILFFVCTIPVTVVQIGYIDGLTLKILAKQQYTIWYILWRTLCSMHIMQQTSFSTV